MKRKVVLNNGKKIVSLTKKKVKIPFGIATLLLSIASMLVISVTGYAQDTENESIKKVIRTETESYYKADGQAWQATWAHEAGNSRIFISNGNYSGMSGWESYGPATLKELKEAKAIPITFKNDHYKILREGNLAIVEYDQILADRVDDTTHKHISHEFRTLKKDNGVWKIVSQTTVDTESFKMTPENIESSFNAIGYKFLADKKMDEAIDVFLMNVKLYPNAWNTYDSLGEAYALTGQKELAIKNYEKSIQLNPKSETGVAALAKLKEK